MKSLLLALVLAISCAASLAADDDKCKNDFQSFLTCVKTQYENKPQGEKDAAKKAREDKADKCFADASCDAPDWSSDPMKQHMGGGGHGGMQMPDTVKQCLKKKLVEKIGTKLNECLSKKGVQHVNFSAIADSVQGAGLGMEGHGGAGKDGLHAGMAAKFNAVKAVDKCAQKKGGDTNSVKPLEQCLHNIKKDAKPEICKFIKPCEDKVSGDCKKRGREITKALCECKKEKESEISKKLRDLGQNAQKDNKKVGIQELIKAVADDQDMQDMMKQVDACYTEADEPEPPIVKLAMQLLAGKGGSGGGSSKMSAALSVSASTCIIMADMMELEANDKSECENCP
jgi:hypothetical protein